MDLLQLVILGIGVGTGYVLIGQGIVLIYRGSGTLNFAQGAIAMVAAQIYFSLQDDHGRGKVLSLTVAVVAAALIGVLIQILVLRPLRNSSALIRLVATLALMTFCMGAATLWRGTESGFVSGVLPAEAIEIGSSLVVPVDRLYLFAIALGMTVVLSQIYRRTRFGLATAGAAENERAATLLGWSPSVLGGINWAVGCGLAGVAGVLMSSVIGLSVRGLTIMVVPGLAAALIGRFSSFWWTLAGGLAVGVAQSFAVRYITEPGFNDAVPFLAITALVVLRGQALPLRGEFLDRPVGVGVGRVPLKVLVPAITLGFAAIALLSSDWVLALSTTLSMAIIGLSFVVLTGYAGQISLAQLTIAGIGAWIAGVASYYWNLPMAVAVGLAVTVTVLVGVLVGLPALRTRGMNLAVITLGMSVMIEGVVLSNKRWQGGLSGLTVDPPSLFGFDISYVGHPRRYTSFLLMVFILCGTMVANIRRSQTGRKLLAIRSNERAAASLGISVTGGKLFAFALAAGLAGLGGALNAFQFKAVGLLAYTTLGSITLLLNTVLGGMGYVYGGLQAGLAGRGGIITYILGSISGDAEALLVVIASGVVLAMILVHPEGIASRWAERVDRSRVKRGGRPAGPDVSGVIEAVNRPVADDRAINPGGGLPLRASGVTVRYGSVTAVRDVSFEVEPGQVLGIIGPNGAGKTTLIDALCGFTRSTGEIVLGGEPIDGLPASSRARAGLTRTFQAVELFDDMSLLENIQVAAGCGDSSRLGLAHLRDLVRPRRRSLPEVALAAIREFELAEDLTLRTAELPAGRQRLAGIARALSTDPRVICLDEPAAGLSDIEAAELAGLVRAIADRWGLSVIVIEHNVEFVRTVSDRVLALDLGMVIAEGTAEEVLASDAVVAAYTGSAPEAPEDAMSGAPE